MGPSRRRVLQVAGSSVVLGLSGCAALGGPAGDLVFENDDGEHHFATAIMDRGSAYTPSLESATLGPESTERATGFLGRSDWNYPFLLHVYVDGSYVETTEHRWQDEVTVRILSATQISATETDRPVDITPQVRSQTRT